jgi:glycosyltransferase involved in cell wall biosynthesis
MSELAAPARSTRDPRLAGLRCIAVVPAYNEEESIGRVIEEIRAFDPEFDIVVVDDGSADRTSDAAEKKGAHVVRLPFNLGIGGAVQTGFRYAAEQRFELAVRVDGDGQHDASELPKLLEPILSDEADIAVGSRFVTAEGFLSSRSRRVGIRILAAAVSALVHQRVTDPTSGFQAVNRRAIALFAADYPHDYPEVEATVLVAKHRLRRTEVPVTMRERSAGRSSIGTLHSVYYMAKVMLALFVGMFRRDVTPAEPR